MREPALQLFVKSRVQGWPFDESIGPRFDARHFGPHRVQNLQVTRRDQITSDFAVFVWLFSPRLYPQFSIPSAVIGRILVSHRLDWFGLGLQSGLPRLEVRQNGKFAASFGIAVLEKWAQVHACSSAINLHSRGWCSIAPRPERILM
jgi:hypothetical protein